MAKVIYYRKGSGLLVANISSKEKVITELLISLVKGKKFKSYEPILIENRVCPARLLQNTYKKINKRGGGATLLEITMDDNIIKFYYRTTYGKGCYRILTYP